jgi:hypothetical protein
MCGIAGCVDFSDDVAPRTTRVQAIIRSVTLRGLGLDGLPRSGVKRLLVITASSDRLGAGGR